MLLVILLQSALATAGSADIDNAFNDMLGASSMCMQGADS